MRNYKGIKLDRVTSNSLILEYSQIMKSFKVLLLNIMFLANVFGQEKGQTSFCYNPNIPKMPLGLNVFYQPKSNFTIFADYKYYKKSNGTDDNEFDWTVNLFWTGSQSGSYSGSGNSDYYEYGVMNLIG